MKKRKKTVPTMSWWLFGILSAVFLAGLLLAGYTYIHAKNNVYNNYNLRLEEMADAVDYNASGVIDRCNQELEHLVQTDAIRAAEEKYLSTGNSEVLRRELASSSSSSSLFDPQFVHCIAVREDGRFLFSTDGRKTPEYRFEGGSEGDRMRVCYNLDTNEYLLAFSVTSDGSALEYFLMLRMDELYRKVVDDRIYDSYWIVLYDSQTGLVLQNDVENPTYKILTTEEIRVREDGLSCMLTREGSGVSGTDVYQYTRSDGTLVQSRIYVLPKAASQNGCFTVSAAVYDADIVASTEKWFRLSIASCLMIAFSAAILVLLILHRGTKAKELVREAKLLERRNAMLQDVLSRQNDVVHRQKLETIGVMTSGISHEFNNLLSPIMGNSLLLLEQTPDPDSLQYEQILEIYEAAQRAKTLIAQIATLSRKIPASQMQEMTAEQLFGDVMTLAQPTKPENVTIEKTVLTEKTFLADSSQLPAVFLNLLLNAVQAMAPNGGTATLRAENDEENVILTVSDTGPGIPEDNLDRIFDPFFTTKPSGKGTGLGLAIAQNVVRSHGGTIRAGNAPDGGARFTITLHIFTGEFHP